MSLEFLNLTSIEKELRFSQWCRNEGVKCFLLDLDDTLCPTRQVFKEFMSQAYCYLENSVPAVSKEKWKEEIETINDRLFEKLGVNSNRWNYVVDELAEKHLLGEKIKQETKQIFQQIYDTPFTFLDGAEEGLTFIGKVGIPIGIVTHAGPEWTWKKYNWLNLRRFLNWDDVFMVDENKHKTTESWVQAIRYFGLKAGECAVVGDSPRSDINPAREAGVRNCFLVEDPKQWVVHDQQMDESVKKIKSLNRLIEALF